MSRSMKNWIRPLVEFELRGALTNFEGKYIPGQRSEDGHRVCGPDIVSVSVHRGQEIQIIEVHGSSGSYEATVSDGTTFISGTFDKDATNLFTKLNGRDFLETRGGVLALMDYTVEPMSLTLDVGKFRFRGSEGSKIFGTPRDILENGNIQAVLERLENLLDGDGGDNEIISQPPSPVRSQIESTAKRSPQSSINAGTQVAFATQIPVLKESVPAKRVELAASRAGEASKLLGLLMVEKATPSGQSDLQSAQGDGPPHGPIAESNSRRQAVLTPVSGDRVLQMTTKLEAKANEQGQSSLSSQLQASGPKSQSESTSCMKTEDTHVLFSGDSEKENSQESLQPRRLATAAAADELIQNADSGQANVEIIFMDQFQLGNPFEGLKRVPRRYVRISQSQQALLESKTSWYEPANNSRSAYANMPPEVHSDLNTFLESKASSKTPSLDSRLSDADSNESADEDETKQASRLYESEEPEEEAEASFAQLKDETRMNRDPPDSFQTPPGRSSDPGSDLEREWTPSPHQQRLRANETPIDNFVGRPRMPQSEEKAELSCSRGRGRPPKTRLASSPTGAKKGRSRISPTSKVKEASSPSEGKLSPESSASFEEDEVMAMGMGQRRETSLDNVFLDDERYQSQIYRQTPPQVKTSTHWNTSGSQRSEPASSLPPRHERSERMDQQSIRRLRAAVLIPSSDPAEEEELELVVPYAIGDLIAEDDSDNDSAADIFLEPPSTAMPTPKSVQVKQTPSAQFRRLEGRALQSRTADGSSQDLQREDDIVSSDSRIPATCDVTISEKISSSAGDATGGGHKPQNQRISEKPNASDLAPERPFAKQESSQLDHDVLSSTRERAIPSVDMNSTPKRPSLQARAMGAAPPMNLDIRDHALEQNSSPPVTPSSIRDNGSFEGSSPATIGSRKRAGDGFGSSPINPSKRRRRIASLIMEEDSPARDPKEMARANRHRFHTSLTAADRVGPQNTPPGFSRSTDGIPSTKPAIKSLEALLPDGPVPSSSEDCIQNIPATFEELEPPQATQMQRGDNATPPIQDKLDSPAADPNQEVESRRSPGKQTDTVILRASLPTTESETPKQLDFYEQFKSAYPNYAGKKEKFIWALVYIEWLWAGKQYLHKSLCDDFIVILASDFRKHVANCAKTGDAPLTGWEFFNLQHQDDPVFKNKIVTPATLQEAIASLDGTTVTEYREMFQGPAQATIKQPQAVESANLVPTQPLSSVENVPAAEITRAEDFEELELPSNTQEGSPELGSACWKALLDDPRSRKSVSVSSRKQSSPELGSAKGSSSGQMSRKRYFETYSQLPSAQHQPERTPPRTSDVVDLTSKSKRRSLPWQIQDSTVQPSRVGIERSFSTSTTSSPNERNGFSKPEERKTSTFHPPARPAPSSPILGSASSSSRPLKRSRIDSSAATPRNASNKSSPPAPTLETKETNSTKASGWTNDAKFKYYAQKRAKRITMEARSNAGTPNSSFSKRKSFQGTPSADILGRTESPTDRPSRLEPETQGWES